jgi:hypothetical protein
MRRRSLVAVALLAVAVPSCRGCGARGPDDVRELAAADAGAAFVVPDLGIVVRGLDAFVAGLTREAGATTVRDTRANLARELGLDPLDVASYERFGLEPRGGAAVFTEGKDPAPILALAVADRARLDEQLAAFFARVDGAAKLSEEQVAGTSLHSAGRPFGSEVAPAFHWAHLGRFVLITRADGRPALAAALERLSRWRAGTPSLRTEPTYAELTAKVPGGDVLLFGRGDAASALLRGEEASLSRGAATSVHVGADGLSADSFVSLALPGLETSLAAPAAADLATRVGEDAVLVLLSRQARPEALAALRRHPATSRLLDRIAAPLREHAGLDPEKDIAPLLAGPLTASVHLSSAEALATRVRQRQTDPYGLLDGIHVVLTATVADTRGMTALLDRSKAVLEKRGITVTRRVVSVHGREALVFTPLPRGAPRGTPSRVAWALLGDTYVYAAGVGRLETELALLAGEGKALTAAGLGPVGGKLAGRPGSTLLLVRAGAIAASAQGLATAPSATQGGVEALVSGGVAVLRALGDLGLAVSAEPGGLRLELRESLK